jgi:hypothetical protein
MPTIIPNSKPRLAAHELHEMLKPYSIDRVQYPLIVVGIRAYYKNTMGAPYINDRGIYDDALFIDTPSVTAAFNGNTDPSKVRPGYGTGSNKVMAVLKKGAWFSYQFGYHRLIYRALCQNAGPVTVIRDGNPPYEDTGYFGINIHKGKSDSTSSEGCQTLHPSQWDSFIDLAVDQAKRYFGEEWKKRTIPYVLFENV